MPYYVDTSAFLKVVVTEDHSTAMTKWAHTNEDALFSSDLMRTELLRTAHRHSADALAAARRKIDAITLVSLTTDVCDRAAALEPVLLRTLDALHLAAALAAGEELEGIVTYDDRLSDAAHLQGLEVIRP